VVVVLVTAGLLRLEILASFVAAFAEVEAIAILAHPAAVSESRFAAEASEFLVDGSGSWIEDSLEMVFLATGLCWMLRIPLKETHLT
jgi:hypothetical protein